MRDDLEGLGEYLSEFSTLGGTPTSLGGYGFGRTRHEAELGAMGAVMQPSPGLPAQPKGTGTVNASKVSSTVLQNYLNALQLWVKKTGLLDAATSAAWNKYVTLFREPHANISAARTGDGLEDRKTTNISAQALKRMQERAAASGNLRTEAARPIGSTPTATQPSTRAPTANTAPTPAPTSASTKEFTTSTASVQDVLIRLGWRDKDKTSGPISKDLQDGFYGGTTVFNWQQSARKRALDPAISKASADGRQVKVSEKTFYALKVVADSLSPPTATTPQPAPPPSAATLTITEKRLAEVLARLTGAPAGSTATWAQLSEMYRSNAVKAGLDPSITRTDASKVSVAKSTWDAFVKAYDEKAPAPAPSEPSEKQNVEAAKKQILKQATVSIPTATVRDAFNIAIKQGVLKREPFSASTWTADFVPPLLTMIKPADGIWQKAWEQLLVPGKLVSSDKKSVKLLSSTSSALKKLVSDYQTAQKADTESYAGYTEVNTAKIIEAVNKTYASSKDFNPSGGAKELADAAKTFLDNTKQVVTGDLVKVNQAKKVFLKTDALTKISDAVQKAKEREAATESHRKVMLSEALKAASADVTVDQLQQAFAESVSSGKVSGDLKKLYSAVKLNGAFDSATRAAYTELARTPLIGLSVQQFQQLLVQQLGPRFKPSTVTEVRNKVWSDVLDKTVAKKDGKQHVKTLPTIAKSVAEASDVYRRRKSDAKVAQEKLAEQKKTLDEAVKKSTIILSVFDVQQGLLYAAQKKEIDPQPSLKVGGRADGPTRNALFELSGMIFPKGYSIPDLLWAQYLDAVGIRVDSPTNVKKGWSGATYVALPQAAANYLAGRAELWMAEKGVPAGYAELAPVPLHNQELRLRFNQPSVITVKRPQKVQEVTFDDKKERELAERKRKDAAKKAADAKRKKAAEKKKLADAKRKKAEADKKLAAQRKKEAAEAEARAQADRSNQAAQEAARKAAQEAAAADAVAAKSETEAVAARADDLLASRDAQQAAEVATGGAQSAGGSAGGGQAAGGQASGGSMTFTPEINITSGGGGGAAADAPPSAPPSTPETPVEPTQAGMGSGLYWWLAAAGVGYMVYNGGDKAKEPQKRQDTRRKKRYPVRARIKRRKP